MAKFKKAADKAPTKVKASARPGSVGVPASPGTPAVKFRTIKSSAKAGTVSRKAVREAVLALKKRREAACN